jgi:F0F1-type ATP synthase assembly protein I
METLVSTQAENAQVVKRNAELAQELCELAETIKAEARASAAEPETQAAIERLKAKVINARRKWRIMKSLVSAIVAGSGVNWAQDEELRDLVIDDEDDEIEELD